MAKPSNLQLRAVLLTLLLAGAEGARIDEGAKVMLEADTINDALSQLGDSSGSPVCGDMTDPVAAVKRYEDKRAKLTALSDSVLKANCMASCPLKINEIKSRMKDFKSCTTALAGGASMPAGLRSAMTSSASGSLSKTLMQVSTDLMSLMKKNGKFKPNGGCEFKPEGFEAEAAVSHGDMDTVRKSIFGNDCGSEESVNAYIASSPESEGTMMTDFMEKVSKLVQTVKHAKETGESKEKELAELEADIEEAGSALLELDSEGALQDVEGTGFIGIIIALVIWILFFLILMDPVGL